MAGRLLAGLFAVLGVACDRPEQQPPITTPEYTWSWVDVANTTCDEGTPTGMGANLSGSKDLLIFFNGGGACWDAITCLEDNTSAHGPFTKAQFDSLAANALSGSILNRQLANNPFRDWNLFFIPYCTGDLHIGNAKVLYAIDSTSKTFHHKGRVNAEAFLARIAATVPSPSRVVVTGSSAGGYGAALNYPLVRSHFPDAEVFLIDDSGPLLKNNAIPQQLRDAWAWAWNYDAVLDAIDPAVKNDFSALHAVLARKYPQDRMALLSSQQDQVIRAYLGLSATGFQSALQELQTTVIDPLPNTRYFVTAGQGHTLLLNPASQSSQGVAFLDWLNQMMNESDPTWVSVQP
jgi:hypothetical protein